MKFGLPYGRKIWFALRQENLVCLTAGKFGLHSSCKSSSSHSLQCVQYFHAFKQWYVCQCLGFLMCTQLLMHAIAHGGCMATIRESALKVDSREKNGLLHWRLKPMIILHQAFWSDVLPTVLSPLLSNSSSPRLIKLIEKRS